MYSLRYVTSAATKETVLLVAGGAMDLLNLGWQHVLVATRIQR